MQFLIWSEFYLFQKTIEKPGNVGKVFKNSISMESWDVTLEALHTYHKVLCDKLAEAVEIFQFLGCQKIILVKSSLKVVKWNISDGGARGQKSNIPRLLICDSRQISLRIFKNFQFYIKEFILWTKKISDGSNPFGHPYTKAQNFKPVWPRMRWT